MLADDDGDGIPNYQDRDYKPKQVYASTAQAPKQGNPTNGGQSEK
jgi:hypothetical protein